jgi:hypothetical protein
MSEARSGARSADLEHELDEIANELYAMRPDEFAGARDERARAAKANGHAELARELTKLRKPTQSAWLINLLWRDQRDVMEQLLELGEELRDAQARASGAALHQLTAVRRELEAGMIRQAKALADKAGVSVSASMEREAQETLAAALARPDVADEIRTGRLVKPATYAGFGDMGSVASAASERRIADRDVAKAPSGAAGPAKIDRLEDRAAQRARERREAAERRVAEARSAVEAAVETLAQLERNAETARERQKTAHDESEKVQDQVRELQERLAELQERLREVKVEQVAAEQAIQAAGRRRDQADKAHEAAQRTLEAAERDLQALASS